MKNTTTKQTIVVKIGVNEDEAFWVTREYASIEDAKKVIDIENAEHIRVFKRTTVDEEVTV